MGAFPHCGLQDFAPFYERQSGQVLIPAPEDIEDNIGDRCCPGTGCRLLQPGKEGLHIRFSSAHHHDLPVQYRTGCQRYELCKFRELPGQLRVIPAPEGDGCSHRCNHPHAVPLDLEEPVIITERCGCGTRQHRPVAGAGSGHFRPSVVMVSCSACISSFASSGWGSSYTIFSPASFLSMRARIASRYRSG